MRFLRPDSLEKQIDIDATIERTARQGYFDEPVLRQGRSAYIPLVLLVDRSVSMIAFHPLSEELAAAARQVQPNLPVFYFHNCPVKYVYRTPQLGEPVGVEEWLRTYAGHRVLIVSDAGASRGFYVEQRLQDTIRFLRSFKPQRVAWLNPMPRSRWTLSTATFIASHVSMFTFNDREFTNVFKYFRPCLMNQTEGGYQPYSQG